MKLDDRRNGQSNPPCDRGGPRRRGPARGQDQDHHSEEEWEPGIHVAEQERNQKREEEGCGGDSDKNRVI